ncbi:hypothetical protein [Rhodovulum sp. FJ3]|uniref:hypothetical protein n=1 Tax=Rhodovulum sp. FJ3 TaxID=3079053 RepID=UPI00293DAA50|nr:hypothetical protein [Rhodovulum sp. FJ3]MDV4168851.1 hypothetical protein [Rhodovulum sp. FJ3]
MQDPSFSVVQQQLDLVLSNMGFGFNPYLECCAALEAFNRLDELSDADLSRLGLRREQIAEYVAAHIGTGLRAVQ